MTRRRLLLDDRRFFIGIIENDHSYEARLFQEGRVSF